MMDYSYFIVQYYPLEWKSGPRLGVICPNDEMLQWFLAGNLYNYGRWTQKIEAIKHTKTEYETLTDDLFKVYITPKKVNITELRSGSEQTWSINTDLFENLLNQLGEHLLNFLEASKARQPWHGIPTKVSNEEAAQHKDEPNWTKPAMYYDPTTGKTGLWDDIKSEWEGKEL